MIFRKEKKVKALTPIRGRHKGISLKSLYIMKIILYLRRAEKGVYIFSSKNNISEELRTGGDGYFDVLEIKKDIWSRELHHRLK